MATHHLAALPAPRGKHIHKKDLPLSLTSSLEASGKCAGEEVMLNAEQFMVKWHLMPVAYEIILSHNTPAR